MQGHDQSVAIVLHGPPAVGKTTIGEEIVRRFPGNAKLISLDAGWGCGDARHSGGSRRYADLALATDKILVIELGCGEPADMASQGATQAAAEWIQTLRGANRTIRAFLLWIEWPEARARLAARYYGHEHALFLFWHHIGLYALYEHADPLATFPEIAGFSEQRLNVTSQQTPVIVTDILQRSDCLT